MREDHVTIDIQRNGAGLITAFRSKGHAGDVPAGENVVCAWVSAVTQNALIGLEQELRLPVDYQLSEKENLLSVRLRCEPDAKSQIILGTMERTLEQLAEQYPQYVRIFGHGGEKNV